MLPGSGEILKKGFETGMQPSKTFRIDTVNNRISGMIENLEEVKQAVYCILNTERYDYVIHSWNYGVELRGLYGKPTGVVKSKVKKKIREALTQDDRIKSVDAFSFSQDGHKLNVTFTVHTVFGEFYAEKVVET